MIISKRRNNPSFNDWIVKANWYKLKRGIITRRRQDGKRKSKSDASVLFMSALALETTNTGTALQASNTAPVAAHLAKDSLRWSGSRTWRRASGIV